MTGPGTERPARATLEVRVGEPRPVGDRVRHSAQLRAPDLGTRELWFEIATAEANLATGHADPFVFAPLMLALAGGHDLVVEGATVDAVLATRLVEFVRIWSAWWGYAPARITAETRPPVAPRPGTVAAFSGGVDAAYTAWRHTRGDATAEHRIDALMMLRGMDIPLADPAGYERAAARARRMTDDLGVPLIAVATNTWDLPIAVRHFTGMGVAAGLHLLAGAFGAGLIPSTAAYRNLVVPLNSSPVSDWLLGGSDFAIVHDGAEADRFAKIAALASWPAALASVRVCLKHDDHDDNCGVCHKCMMTLTALRILGVDAPGFAHRPSPDEIRRWARTLPRTGYYLQEGSVLLRQAQARGTDEPWVGALERRIRVARMKDGVRNAFPGFTDRVATTHRKVRARRRPAR